MAPARKPAGGIKNTPGFREAPRINRLRITIVAVVVYDALLSDALVTDIKHVTRVMSMKHYDVNEMETVFISSDGDGVQFDFHSMDRGLMTT